MPTEMELTLEQSQQGVSYEVSNIQAISFTMKMEILLEPTSNRIMVDPHGFKGIFKDNDGDDETRLCLVDDFKKLKDHIHVKTKEQVYIKSQ
ncbi:hypothetical protein Tco_0059989 [Tanacetum coccineum]